jgi:hypothetical protein
LEIQVVVVWWLLLLVVVVAGIAVGRECDRTMNAMQKDAEYDVIVHV